MARPIIVTKIDVTKINKAYLFKGQKGTYLDAAFFENEAGPSQYGDHGFIVQDVPKEQRDQGQRGEIIGNWKYLDPPQHQHQAPPQQQSAPAPVTTDFEADGDEIPF